jgi:hypothetical protein
MPLASSTSWKTNKSCAVTCLYTSTKLTCLDLACGTEDLISTQSLLLNGTQWQVFLTWTHYFFLSHLKMSITVTLSYTVFCLSCLGNELDRFVHYCNIYSYIQCLLWHLWSRMYKWTAAYGSWSSLPYSPKQQ